MLCSSRMKPMCPPRWPEPANKENVLLQTKPGYSRDIQVQKQKTATEISGSRLLMRLKFIMYYLAVSFFLTEYSKAPAE